MRFSFLFIYGRKVSGCRYGTNDDKYPHYIVMECFEHRSLKNYLEKYKTGRGKVIDKRRKPPEFNQLQEWCKDIASGEL